MYIALSISPQGLGRHTTSVREGSVEQAGARELPCQSQQTHSPSTCTVSSRKFPGCPHFIRDISLVEHDVRIWFLSNCNDTLFWSASGHSTPCWACRPFSWQPAEIIQSSGTCPHRSISRPTQSAGIKPPSVTFMNLNVSALPKWHSQPLPTTDSTTGSLSRIVMIRSTCNWACQCLAPKAVSLVTGLIQIRSFTFLLFALIIMLRDTCFRFVEETKTFQFICIICVMLLVLCFDLFQHVPDFLQR